MESQDSSDMHEEEGVEILHSSSTHDEVLDGSSVSNQTISKKQITVLISSGNFNHTQSANQNLALQLLTDLSLPYVTIDGMDADLKAKRDALFEISGIRGNYPQLFLITSNQGARKTMAATTFLGDYAWLENNSAALVDMVMTTPPPPLRQRGGAEFDTRLSALSSEGESFGTGTSSTGKEVTEQHDQDPTLTPKATANIKQQQLQNIEINGAPERQVDWIPEEGDSQISDGSFSQAAVRGDDVTETSFTTMTTVGDGGGAAVFPFPLTVVDESGATVNDTITNTSGVYVRPITGRNNFPARSPRPPRRMRAVDWCPPQHQPPQQQLPLQSFVPSDRTRMSNPSISGITPSVVTSRAVRMADDNTITTFATMTTMGDAGSILEEDMEDEESSSDEDSVNGDELVGEGVETNNDGVPYEDSMEEVEDGNGAVVDKIPKHSNTQGEMSISVATNQSVRAPDDHSVVTFATVATIGDRGNSHVVDRLPSFTATRVGESVTTNETVQIGDHESVATWATMNTMKGQITGNVVDHVPSREEQIVPSNPNAGTEPGASLSIRTSNAVQDERSITTFTTNATAFTERGVQEVVDKIPTFAGGSGRSVMSGVTSQAVRVNDETASFATMTTAGDVGSLYETEVLATDQDQRPRILSDAEYEFDELDRSVVDTIPEATSSVASGTTNHSVRTGEEGSVTTFATMTTAGVDKVPSSNVVSSAASVTTNLAVRINDDQSVATWATMTTSAIAGHTNEHVVDKTPALTGRTDSSIVSGTTNHAIKDRDDQSVVTWNTMTTAGARAQAPNAVDRVPSFYNSSALSISGDTDQAVRTPDDQSVVTFATMTTAGYGRESSNVVDNIPSFNERTDTSVVTSDTVLMGDNESVATWATMNTMRGQITGNVVDHVPSQEESGPNPSQMSVRTSNAVQDERSTTTFTTNATAFTERGIQEVVDKIPTFAGGSGRSVMSGVTSQAVRVNDDRSTASFATMTTAGDPFPQDRAGNTLVDRIPSFADRTTSVSLSGRTDAAKVGDDLTATTFATLTTAGDGTNNTYQNEDPRYPDHSGNDEVMSGSAASRPTAGILRESRHSIKSPIVVPPTGGADDVPALVSNAHILRAITDLRFHVDYRIGELREVNRRDSERVLQLVQQEQARRTALEARLHSHLLMQSESMVATELKVLRLEAKIASRESFRQSRHQSNGGVTMDRLPPIAATPSTPNQSDEEADSFEELDLTPRATRSSSVGQLSQGGGGGNRGGPTNIAVVTRSGASVASAVTAMSFPDEGFSHMDHVMNNDGSEDGDVEDEGDDDDGSQSTPTQGSRNQISNLESILLNPIPVVGGNDQGISTRAIRGDTDGNSSLPTSVTSTTMASTVITATTRGDTSVGIARIPSRASEEDALAENIEEQPRSRDQSPLTVQSAATETLQSVASASLGPSILSTAAVAPARSFGTRRANAAIAAANAQEGRSLANRVVSFTTNDLVAERLVPPQENDGGGDSITMPDDLDNDLSDIADVFSNSARAWREEYEQRLDAIHKRLDSR
ncbi:hypothetical protein QTG54_000475 [Skeletonema marinoi]|uniref:Uncharacterized protein n=1 Tax=Skeletonema marinoi TaxID=267567 RepID=A0AAD8YL20_9STRA|nr:hypothetical protein QTG54_000475 [Skeletonema marinoi]